MDPSPNGIANIAPSPYGRWIRRAGAWVGLAVFFVLVGRFWHPAYGFTAFLQVGANWEDRAIAAFREYPVFIYDAPDCYDGLQYAQIAYHPLLKAPELQSGVDTLPYRARRILLPAVAWTLAAGQPAWIAHVYAGLNLACWLALAALLWRALPVRDARGLIGWTGILFSAGALASVRFALTDLPAVLLMVAAVWAAERARPRAAVAWLAAAALTRETALIALPGLGPGRWDSWRAVARGLALAALAAVPLAAWLVYVRWRAGPGEGGWGNFSWPLAAQVTAAIRACRHLGDPGDPVAFWGTVFGVAGLAAQIAFIVVRRQPGDRWWRVGAIHALFMSVLGPLFWLGFPFGAGRVLLPLTVAANMLAVRTRASLGWLLACNLTAVAGVMVLWSVPGNAGEIAATRHGAASGVVRLTSGWYDLEQGHQHRWAWSASAGRLTVRTWPRSAAVATQLHFDLRGLNPRTVAIRCGGREIWRGLIGTKLTPVTLPLLTSRDGRLDLELATDAPPLSEAVGPAPRLLGFALYDPVLSVSESGAADP